MCYSPSYGGLRRAWIDQKYDVTYDGVFQFLTGGTVTSLSQTTTFDAKNCFKGIGLRFGSDGEWFITPHWTFLGGASTSMLYGKFNIHERIAGARILDLGTGPVLFPETLTEKRRIHRPRINFEGLLGLQWHTCSPSKKCRLGIGAFYEFSYWLNQNEIYNRVFANNTYPINDVSVNNNVNASILHEKGNLQLHGVSVQLEINAPF